MDTFSLFLITRNRPHLLKLALNSVLNQTISNFPIIVSDNSTNNETKEMVESLYLNQSNIIYRKREREYGLIEHWNKVLSEVRSEYFMIFHDDDVMHPDMIRTMLNIIKKDHSLAFIATNARIIKKGRICYSKYKGKEKIMRLKEAKELFQMYAVGNWIPPFPSYIYSKSIADNMRFAEDKGGKYCDVAFLLDAIDLGNLAIITKPYMDYYYHDGQVSQFNDYFQRIKLINYVRQKMRISPHDRPLVNFKLMNLYCWINNLVRNSDDLISKKRFVNCLKIFLKHRKYMYVFKLLGCIILREKMKCGKL